MQSRRNYHSRRNQIDDDILAALPWQLEVLLLLVLPAAFFFAIWQVVHSITEKSEVLSQALGVQMNLGIYYDQFKPYALIAAGIFSIRMYFKARKWILRKIFASLG